MMFAALQLPAALCLEPMKLAAAGPVQMTAGDVIPETSITVLNSSRVKIRKILHEGSNSNLAVVCVPDAIRARDVACQSRCFVAILLQRLGSFLPQRADSDTRTHSALTTKQVIVWCAM